MVRLVATRRDGSTEPVEATPGMSLMLNLRCGGVDEIAAICGGSASCGTCHVYVAEDWLDRLPPIEPDEEVILGFSDWRRPNSRLACQIRVSDALDGLAVAIAPED